MKHKEICTCVLLNLLLIMLVTSIFAIQLARADAPYRQLTYEYNWQRLLDNEKGTLNIITDVSFVKNDGSSQWDWYYFSNLPTSSDGIRFNTVPGQAQYGNGWETAHTYAQFIVTSRGSDYGLIDWDPSYSQSSYDSGSGTVSVSISVGGVTLSYSYAIPYIIEYCYCNAATGNAQWNHDIHEQSDPGWGPSVTSYTSRPAFVVKVPQNEHAYVTARTGVMWGQGVWWGWQYSNLTAPQMYMEGWPV
jgi:hypothetical protein